MMPMKYTSGPATPSTSDSTPPSSRHSRVDVLLINPGAGFTAASALRVSKKQETEYILIKKGGNARVVYKCNVLLVALAF